MGKPNDQLVAEIEEAKQRINELETSLYERKQSEQLAWELTQILEQIHYIVITTDMQGYIVRWNKGAQKIYGYSIEEALGKHISFMFVDENKKNRFYQQATALILEKGSYDTEAEVVTKAGEKKWIHLSLSPITDNDGTVIMVCGYGLDITKRKEAEQRLKKSEQQYRAIFEQASDSIVIVDAETSKIMSFNNKAHENLGYSREEFGKLKLSQIALNSSDKEVMSRVYEIRQKGAATFETKHKTKSGEIKYVLVSARTINIDGKIVGMAVWHDITEFKHAENRKREIPFKEEQDRQHIEFLANLSHEIRTPLASIKGFLSVLLDYSEKLDDNDKREYIETINSNTDRLIELIDKLVDMSQPGAENESTDNRLSGK